MKDNWAIAADLLGGLHLLLLFVKHHKEEEEEPPPPRSNVTKILSSLEKPVLWEKKVADFSGFF